MRKGWHYTNREFERIRALAAQGLSRQAIADTIGRTKQAVNYACRVYDITTHGQSRIHQARNTPAPTREELVRLYVIERKSVREMRGILHMCCKTIIKHMTHHHILRRPVGRPPKEILCPLPANAFASAVTTLGNAVATVSVSATSVTRRNQPSISANTAVTSEMRRRGVAGDAKTLLEQVPCTS